MYIDLPISTIVLNGQITWVGHTSMEVRVDTFVEELTGQRTMINRAYLVMVALDEHNRSVPVPDIVLSCEEEKLEWEAGVKRNAMRMQRRTEGY